MAFCFFVAVLGERIHIPYLERQSVLGRIALTWARAIPHCFSMNLTISLTPQQLRRAADIKEKIQSLTRELENLFGPPAGVGGDRTPRRKRRMSAAGRARIAAAARARWARIKGSGDSMPRPRRKMSAAGRARIAAAARERWKKAKAQGKTTL